MARAWITRHLEIDKDVKQLICVKCGPRGHSRAFKSSSASATLSTPAPVPESAVVTATAARTGKRWGVALKNVFNSQIFQTAIIMIAGILP
jgi:hypothetical protein